MAALLVIWLFRTCIFSATTSYRVRGSHIEQEINSREILGKRLISEKNAWPEKEKHIQETGEQHTFLELNKISLRQG